MITSVLLDLDDTLLDNDVNTFIPAYMHRLSEYMTDYLPPDDFIRELMAGTQRMLENQDPTRTLETAFREYFFPASSLNTAEATPIFERFYREEFPKLKDLTRMKPSAKQVIGFIRRSGWDLVIATNPLFPRLAIEERLRWADLVADIDEFTLITTYENSHFSKPHMEYYAEILGMLGRYPNEAVMVGDDLVNDLGPSESLGLRTFHVHEKPDPAFDGGSLEDLPRWLKEASGQNFTTTRTSRSIKAMLRGNLAALQSTLGELPPSVWTKRPQPDEWAPVEIICHLRDLEEALNLPRVQAILDRHDPHIQAFDTHQWAVEREYIRQSGPDALKEFTGKRLQLLEKLSNLNDEAWLSAATHTLFGPTNLTELMSFAADHDILHLRQLRETIP